MKGYEAVSGGYSPADDNNAEVEYTIPDSTSDDNGKISFNNIIFKYEGIYTFVIREKNGSDNDTIYDNTEYKVIYTVGRDGFGFQLEKALKEVSIATDNLCFDDVRTTLAVVQKKSDGDRDFFFYRNPGADIMLRPEEIRENLIKMTMIFHFGSLSLTDQPAKDATVAAVTCAKEAGALISYDPNYRATLWSSEAEAAENMKSMISYADVMKVSDEESLLLTGETTYEAAADKLLAMGPKLIAVTLGSEGVLMATKEKKERVKGFSVQSVDTTGAGDSFWGGTLSAYLSLEKPIESLTWEEIHHCAVCGNATAALCVQKRGGIPAIPTKEEVEQMLAEKSC